MTSPNSITQLAAFGLEPTYSAREAAVLLGRSYSWLDQRLREDQFIRPDGTTVQPLRTQGGYRRFTLAMLEDIALSSYRHHWFSMEKLKLIYRELLIAAHRDTGEYKIPGRSPSYGQLVAVGQKASTSDGSRVAYSPFASFDSSAAISLSRPSAACW
jgi:hypothetical protein